MYVCMYYVCVCVYVCMHVCMYLCKHVCVCMYVCMCIFMYVCVYVYMCVYVLADCFMGRTIEEPCLNFHQGKEFYFLFSAPRGPLEPIQFVHLSGTGYSSQGVKAAQELTTCT